MNCSCLSGSAEEVEDLKKAYTGNGGAIEEIMKHIPHSTHDDEARFIVTITGLIKKGELESTKTWESSIKDEKAKLIRKKQSEKEAKEAEKLAKELGVWDEFYGSGKAGPRKGKSKGKGKEKAEETEEGAEEDEEDHSALKALMMKRKKNMDGFFDNLAAKYADADKPKGKKGKKRGAAGGDEEGSPKKKSKRGASPPPIDDEEFEKLQQKLFGGKANGSKPDDTQSSSKSKTERPRRAAAKKAR